MDREALVVHLTRTYGELLSITSITADADGLGPFAEQVLAIYSAQPDLSHSWAGPLAEYFLLDQLAKELMGMPTRVTVDGDSYDVGKVYERIAGELARLHSRLRWILDADAPVDDGIGKVVTVYAPFLTGGF